MKPQVFALVDANKFYANCEKVGRPDLRDRPVVVLSNNDGCVVAACEKARALGIPMFGPFFEVEALCKRHNVAVFSSNYSLYGDLSGRLMTVLAEHAPNMEVYSIDEAFLDFTGVQDIEDRAHRLRQEVLRRVGIPTCVGIGSSKTLAKLANHTAKKRPEWSGVFDWSWLSESEQDRLLSEIEVGEVWGIGRRLTEKLGAMGITNALQLKHADPRRIKRRFNVVTERTVQELNGVSCLALEDVTPAKQQIIASRSFAHKVKDLSTLASSIAHHTARAAEKLREQQSTARLIGVSISTSTFSEHDQYHPYTVVPLVHPTDDTIELTHSALAGLRCIYKHGYLYHRAGVILMEIGPREVQQTDMFAPLPSPRRHRLMAALDAINQEYGRSTIHLGAEGLSNRWEMRQDLKSPCWTTRWDQLIEVR
ncbi:Y-family DNA polymerase [Pseudogulbenkiania subflava]|uniref:DNA polymerase V n=1 Tax=Pseudogulbenkiania subflava DSM 22618 TaxID=1123014 RepID=A0A1Y6BQ05_9NEIS|nr:Y-family DNA polymerase [Pseudogulbenkiania subflava]SMF13906.1 DNA polymerase V [Pseudogulbenkiania subflava DSM 22618]